MTSSGDIAPLDPDVFSRRQLTRNKLAAHEKLIGNLLQKGWSAYMIWRYLSEECQIVISRTSVYNACVRQKAERVAADGGPTAFPANTMSATPTSAVIEATTPTQTPSQDPVAGNIRGAPRVEPPPVETVPRRTHDRNDGFGSNAFAPKHDAPPPKIATPGNIVTRPGSGLMHRYDRDDPALVRAAEEEREFRRKGGRDNQTMTSDHKGPQDE